MVGMGDFQHCPLNVTPNSQPPWILSFSCRDGQGEAHRGASEDVEAGIAGIVVVFAKTMR